jgi:hypothetical protein
MIEDLNSLFPEISIKKINITRQWEDLIFVLANEFGWTQEDISNTEIPYIMSLLIARDRFKKDAEKRNKKGMR